MIAIVKILYLREWNTERELATAQWMVGDIAYKNGLLADDGFVFWDESGSSYEDFITKYILNSWAEYAQCN